MDWELVNLLLALPPDERQREIKLLRAACFQAEVFSGSAVSHTPRVGDPLPEPSAPAQLN